MSYDGFKDTIVFPFASLMFSRVGLHLGSKVASLHVLAWNETSSDEADQELVQEFFHYTASTM